MVLNIYTIRLYILIQLHILIYTYISIALSTMPTMQITRRTYVHGEVSLCNHNNPITDTRLHNLATVMSTRTKCEWKPIKTNITPIDNQSDTYEYEVGVEHTNDNVNPHTHITISFVLHATTHYLMNRCSTRGYNYTFPGNIAKFRVHSISNNNVSVLRMQMYADIFTNAFTCPPGCTHTNDTCVSD